MEKYDIHAAFLMLAMAIAFMLYAWFSAV